MTDIKDCRNQVYKYSIEEMIEQENIKRGFDVTVLDKDALLERIKAKDWSAYYLGKAFVSMYRPSVKATLNLTDTCNLDSKGKNFLFKIIFARDVEGWNCDFLYSIEQEIKEILQLTVNEDDLLVKIEK